MNVTFSMCLWRSLNVSIMKIIISVACFVAFAACLFSLYSLMPVVIEKTSAAAVNLNLLSADFYALLLGIFFFKYKVSVSTVCVSRSVFSTLPFYVTLQEWSVIIPRANREYCFPTCPSVRPSVQNAFSFYARNFYCSFHQTQTKLVL